MKTVNCGFRRTMFHCIWCENLSRKLVLVPYLLLECQMLTVWPISTPWEQKHLSEMSLLIFFTREMCTPAHHARRMFHTGFFYFTSLSCSYSVLLYTDLHFLYLYLDESRPEMLLNAALVKVCITGMLLCHLFLLYPRLIFRKNWLVSFPILSSKWC